MKRIGVRGRVLLNMIGRRRQYFEPKKVYEVDDETAAHPYLVGRLSFVEDVEKKVKEEPKTSADQVRKAPTRRRKSK